MSETGFVASHSRPATETRTEPRRDGRKTDRKADRKTGREADELCRAYAETGRGLYAMAYRALGDRGLAEDLVQETFARAWRSRALYDEAKSSRKN